MSRGSSRRILIAGAGVAGLAAGLAFARRGFEVQIFEQADALEEIGAGLQLSPNATRILNALGVLDSLLPAAVRPQAVVLRRASDLAELARVPLGEAASRRWGSPYIVCHRADLQSALLNAVLETSAISLATGARVKDFGLEPARLAVEAGAASKEHEGALVVAADGVWSAIRAHAGDRGRSRFIGQLAWRRTLDVGDADWAMFAESREVVSAYLSPGFHLIAYPMRGGTAMNLAAFTTYRRELPRGWAEKVDVAVLQAAIRRAAPDLARLADSGERWTAFPIHVADLDGAWSDPSGLALIGDAAHAMTPFAAQGAAMAIEDAETLAQAVSARPEDLGAALRDWTVARRRRVLRVARRGALNQFAWHARGPAAAARDAFLRWRGPEKLAADLDWLYGWKAG